MDTEVRNEDEQALLGPSGASCSGYGSLAPPPVHLPTPGTLQPQGSTIIEPVMFILLVASALSNSVITNLIEYKICRVQLGLPHINCTDPIDSHIENLIQPTTAHVITDRSLIEALVPSMLAVLIGPWSDTNGRKPFLITAILGMALSYLCWGYLAMLPHLTPHWFLVACLPLSLTGGFSSIFLLVFCYISDVTDNYSRSFRMSVLGLAMYASPVFGLICAPLLVTHLEQAGYNPYPVVFFLSAGLLLVAVVYTHWWVRESVVLRPNRDTRLFLLSHVSNILTTCFKSRRGNARVMALLIVASLCLIVFINEGESAVMYLSTREMFSWQLAEFSVFTSFSSLVYGFGSMVGVWLFIRLLKLPTMPVAALVLVSRVARGALMAEATCYVQFYLAVSVSAATAAFSPLCRTELPRLVPREDLGKVYALAALLESLTPVIAAPLYTTVYETTFLHDPGAVYWLSALLSCFSVVMIMVVVILQRLVGSSCYIDESEECDTNSTAAKSSS